GPRGGGHRLRDDPAELGEVHERGHFPGVPERPRRDEHRVGEGQPAERDGEIDHRGSPWVSSANGPASAGRGYPRPGTHTAPRRLGPLTRGRSPDHWYWVGSGTPASANPFLRSWHESHDPHARPAGSGS